MLPIFNLKNKQKSYGKNTKDALNAGFIWGYEGLINNIISKITTNWKMDYKIILTGGYANLFKKIIEEKLLLIKILQSKVSRVYREFLWVKRNCFCPLGGSGEIGGNMNLYAYGKTDNQKWIIVDMGVSFADDSVPGRPYNARCRFYHWKEKWSSWNCFSHPWGP